MFDLIPEATDLNHQSAVEKDLAELVKSLLKQAKEHHQRRTLVITGESGWCRQQAQFVAGLAELEKVSWLSTETLAADTPAKVEWIRPELVKQLLGQEREVVAFDAHCGFDPVAFGVVSGIIRGGGLLILLCPFLQHWEDVADPASERIAISPYGYQDISGRFIRRLVKVLDQAQGLCVVEQDKPLPSLPSIRSVTAPTQGSESTNDIWRTADQKTAIEAIEHVVKGHRRRPVVLVSDRGRGKSAALGIAAARLLIDAPTRTDHARGFMRIVVTAPQRVAVGSLFFHACQLLDGAEIKEHTLLWKGSRIEYITPDVFSESLGEADLVLVDEAAAIPVFILNRLLDRYSRIVFATTVHGYEGTGRGFAIRFRQTLDEKTPGWREVVLKQPIRWAENDPLEQLVFRGLLLDADSVSDDLVSGIDREHVTMEYLDRDKLVEDEQTLSQLFGLLVSAHYQTTPNDLRNLLDGPGVSVYVMRSADKKQVLATALVSAEGEFSDELADAISDGSRRPRGHLLSQSLVAHMGIRQAAFLRCARIMRIAVHPALQRKGLGSQLMQFVQSQVKAHGFHLFGTSFGATPELLTFWKQQGLSPVRMGFRRDHASGEHSVMMLAPLSDENSNAINVTRSARARFGKDLPHWLSDALRYLDVSIVLELLRDCESPVELSGDNRDMLDGFVSGARGYEDCSAVLWRFSLVAFSGHDRHLPLLENRALVTKVLQKRSWQAVESLCEVSGRNEVITLLRSAVKDLLQNQETQ